MIHICSIIDDSACYDEIRRMRWPESVTCPYCTSNKIAKRGKNHRQQEYKRYRCKKCGKSFDDLTGTIFAGRHQPLKIWLVCLYMMGPNMSNSQIAHELGLNVSDMYEMTALLRAGVVKRKVPVRLNGQIEFDEVYIIAGHKGKPECIKERDARRNRLKGAPGRGTLEKEKPPVFGMIQRGGDVRIIMLENVRQNTIKPHIEETVEPGSMVYTDEYNIYSRLEQWGYGHKTVCHGKGEYARDEDGDGFHEVHVNTMEGVWSLSRSWLRPHRGISQEKLPDYLGFFEFVHNVRRRGKALLGPLTELLLQPVLQPA